MICNNNLNSVAMLTNCSLKLVSHNNQFASKLIGKACVQA